MADEIKDDDILAETVQDFGTPQSEFEMSVDLGPDICFNGCVVVSERDVFNPLAIGARLRDSEIGSENNITQLVVTKNNIYNGIIHLHDLLKEKIN